MYSRHFKASKLLTEPSQAGRVSVSCRRARSIRLTSRMSEASGRVSRAMHEEQHPKLSTAGKKELFSILDRFKSAIVSPESLRSRYSHVPSRRLTPREREVHGLGHENVPSGAWNHHRGI